MSDHRQNDVRRRTVVLGAPTVLIASSLAASRTARAAAPTDDQIRAFIRLSAALTGVGRSKLMPNVDEPDVKTEYFRHLDANAQPAFGRLLQLAPAGASDSTILDAVTAKAVSDVDIRFLARSLVLLWYLGKWYAPSYLKALVDAADPAQVLPPPGAVTILSAKAYKHALVWRVGQAHPMGYSDMQFGYWSDRPDGNAFVVGGT